MKSNVFMKRVCFEFLVTMHIQTSYCAVGDPIKMDSLAVWSYCNLGSNRVKLWPPLGETWLKAGYIMAIGYRLYRIIGSNGIKPDTFYSEHSNLSKSQHFEKHFSPMPCCALMLGSLTNPMASMAVAWSYWEAGVVSKNSYAALKARALKWEHPRKTHEKPWKINEQNKKTHAKTRNTLSVFWFR